MADLGDMRIKVGADIAEALSKIDQLKRANIQLAEETAALSTEYKKNANELRGLEQVQKTGIGLTTQTAGRVNFLKERQQELTASIVDNKGVLKQSVSAIKDYDKASQGATHSTSAIGKAFEHITSVQDIAAKSIKSFGKELLHVLPSASAALAGGLVTLVAVVGGQLIDAFSDWFESITKVSDATRLLKAQQDDLNDIVKDANKDAGKQIAELQLLYGAATNVNLSMKERLNAAKALNAEFPETFKNFSAEEIALGKAKTAYDETTIAILKQSRAKAVKGKLDEIASAQLDSDFKRQQLLIETGKKLIDIQKQGDKLQDIGQGVTVKVTSAQQEAAVNASLKFALKQIDVDNKILEERRKFATSFLDINIVAPDTGRLKEIDDQIKFLKEQKELHASTLAETRKFNADIKKLQDERDTIDPPKVKDTKGSKKEIETISDVLKKLAIQIDFLNQKEITLKVNESGAKISAIEGTIDHLLQKFKLASDSPIILNLIAKINDIQLTDQFNKVLKGAGKAQKIDVPLEIQIEMRKPVVEFPPGTFDEQILREELLKRLAQLGVKKTIPIQIGVDIVGKPIFTKPETITSNTSTKGLRDTFNAVSKSVEDLTKQFNEAVKVALQGVEIDVFTGIGEAIGKAAGGDKDVFKGLFDGIFTSLSGALAGLGKFLIKTGVEMKVVKDAIAKLFTSPIALIAAGIGLVALAALLKSAIGKQAPGLAKGGEIKGSGTGTSDSVLIRASKGEYVIRSEVVKKMGIPFFDKLNKGIKPIQYERFMSDRGVPRFSAGGIVTPTISQGGTLSTINIGTQQIEVTGEFKLRNDHLVAAVKNGTKQINRNS